MLRIRDSNRITERNVHCFLRRFAKGISLGELELIPRRYGDSIMFYYGSDMMLKVPKNGHRRALLAETTISRYMNTQALPMVFAVPMIVRPEGFYAVFSRIDGIPLTADKVAGFTSNELPPIWLEKGYSRREILEKILSHYDRDDSTIRQKIEFRLLVDEIHMVYREIRDSLRLNTASQAR